MDKADEENTFYHPIQPLCCRNKSLSVIPINLPGEAFSRDEPFKMLDKLLSCLVWLQLKVDSSGKAASKEQNICIASSDNSLCELS